MPQDNKKDALSRALAGQTIPINTPASSFVEGYVPSDNNVSPYAQEDPMLALRQATRMTPDKEREKWNAFSETPLGKVGAFVSGGATDPNAELGPADLVSQLLGPVAHALPLGAVAGVPPELIKMVKQRGADLIERLQNEGVQMMHSRNTPTGIPNQPLKPMVMEALRFAQQKYPRLFGHINDITSTHFMEEEQQRQLGRMLFGASEPMSQDFPTKFSNVQLNPRLANIPTIGHELQHTADRIARPNFDELYQFTQDLPGGYDANSSEFLARAQGEKFKQKFQKYLEQKDAERIAIQSALEQNQPVIPELLAERNQRPSAKSKKITIK